ncbi:PBAN-type neuropeptides-like [Diaphorina citri]|uniref:PBAN-type neuropeptides-like n=1 Tax=Diaphorina citri TaxID=121845 RepID=A0A1S4EJX7_DIACI|nr:PBAN-type neuropeptides-like [Diaphorina citri]
MRSGVNMFTSLLQWFLCVFSFHLISFTHEARLPRVHLATPDLIEEAMLLGLEMGLARDPDNPLLAKRANPAVANGPMWFGPRLGRRKRSLDEDEEEEKMNELEEEEGEERISDLLRTSPWAIIPLRAKSSISYRSARNFTPRLGRSLSEEDEGSRSPPFAPRLGRDRSRGNQMVDLYRPTPSMGRDVFRPDQDPRIKRAT